MIDNSIDKLGCCYIINNLSYITKLNRLNLDYNKIQFESVMLSDLYEFRNITVLDLQYNPIPKEVKEMKKPEGLCIINNYYLIYL